jgi:acetylornithine/N-succinyldiaminopimelate aminotransferase
MSYLDNSTADLFAQYVTPNYGRFSVAPTHAKGTRLWDEAGKEYLDFGAGIAVDTLGHCHPAMVDAISKQAQTLIHCSNLYQIRPQAELAAILTERVVQHPGKAFFCNSGAEANETLIKLARKFGHENPSADGKSRGEILTFTNSFHGRTMATISATAQEKVKIGFAPLLEGFRHLPYNDVDALKNGITDQTVAILLEPIQGEGGINVATAEFLQAAAALAKKHNLLLMFDEIQSGIARCGNWCGWRTISGAEDIVPHAISWAKGLGGGFPIGAAWINADNQLCDTLGPGTHGTTYGGAYLAVAASRAVIDEIEKTNLCQNATQLGDYITAEVRSWNHPLITEVRGRGLMIGFQLNIDAIPATDKTASVQIVLQLMEAGLLTIPAGASVVRWLPPLNITKQDADEALRIFKQVLD